MKVLILSSIWGHESIAKGVNDVLKKNGFKTRLEIIRIDPFFEKFYKTFYRFAPGLFKMAFHLAKYETTNKMFRKYFEANHFKTIERLVHDYQPDLVISSYFVFDSSIKKLKHKFKFRYLNVVSDPWTFTRIHVSKSALNLVFDQKAKEKAEGYVHAKQIATTGWFVEDKYNTKLTKDNARKIIGVDRERLTVCVTGGSEGTFDVLKITNSFINNQKDVQMLFMCGKNKQLYDLVNNFAKILGKNKKIKIFSYKYTSRMNIFMRASDLVVGKAGPNTIFESVACGVPFFAISHISGQEDGNLELIKKYRIGYAEESPIKIARILGLILKKPLVLEKFQKPIQLLSQKNQNSQARLLEILRN